MKPTLRLLLLSLLFTIIQFPLFAQDQFHEVLRIGRGAVQHAQWQPNGPLILVDTVRGAWLYSNNEGRLVDVRHIEDARLARFSPDGNTVAGVNTQNEITLWNTTDFAQIATRPGHEAYVRALEWKPNGQQLASLDRTGRLLVWNVASVEPAWEVHLDSADQLAWSRGGSYLAAVDSTGGKVQVWDASGDVIFEASSEYFGQYGFDVIWRNDIELLGRSYGEIVSGELWEVKSGKATPLDSLGYASDYSPDGSKFVNAAYHDAFIMDVDSDEMLFFVASPQSVVARWSPDGQYIALGGWTYSTHIGTTVTVVDVAAGAVLRTAPYDHSITGIYWNSDSTQLLIVDNAEQMYVAGVNATSSGRLSNAHTDIGVAAGWRSDGQVIAAADTNYGSRLWDAQTGELLVPHMNQGQPASKLVWQPGGTLLATSGGDGRESANNNVYIWDSRISGETMYERTVVIPHSDLVADVGWSPDGKTLATIESERFLHLWKPDEPNLFRVIDLWAIRLAPYIDYTQQINGLMWSTGSDRLAYSFTSSGNYGGVNVVDTEAEVMLEGDMPVNHASTWAWTLDNQFIWATWLHTRYPGDSPLDSSFMLGRQPMPSDPPLLEGLPGQAVKAIFSPDASLLIGFDSLNNGVIWDVQTRTALTELANVNDAIWSPDNTMLAVYGSDGMIQVIDSRTGDMLYEFEGHFRAEPFYLAGNPQAIWSPDSQRIAVLDNGSLFIYQRGS